MTDTLPTPSPPPPAHARMAFVLLATLSLLAYIAISADVLWHGQLDKLDPHIALHIYAKMTDAPAFISVCSDVSNLGGLTFSIAAGAMVAILLLALGRWRNAVMWVVGLYGSAWLNELMKSRFALPRTVLFSQFRLDDGYTYPSGHIMAAVMTFGLIAYLLTYEAPKWKWLSTICAALIILVVGTSLLLIGVHYLTDILGGLTLGCGWLFLVIAVLGSKKRPPRVSQGFPVESAGGGI